MQKILVMILTLILKVMKLTLHDHDSLANEVVAIVPDCIDDDDSQSSSDYDTTCDLIVVKTHSGRHTGTWKNSFQRW